MLQFLALPNVLAAAYFAACMVLLGAFVAMMFVVTAHLLSGGK